MRAHMRAGGDCLYFSVEGCGFVDCLSRSRPLRRLPLGLTAAGGQPAAPLAGLDLTAASAACRTLCVWANGSRWRFDPTIRAGRPNRS